MSSDLTDRRLRAKLEPTTLREPSPVSQPFPAPQQGLADELLSITVPISYTGKAQR